MTNFTGNSAIEGLIPNFSGFREDISKIALTGFTLAINVRFTTPEIAYSTYPDAWIDLYLRNHHVVMDPIILWTSYNEGIRRWSEIGLPAKLPLASRVLENAVHHGLKYGAVVALRNYQGGGRKCFMSVARADRELTDTELSDVEYLFSELVSRLSISSGLSPSEIEVLNYLAQGLTQDEIAMELNIQRVAVKKRIERARLQLQARNSAHAVAIAIQRNIVRVDRF